MIIRATTVDGVVVDKVFRNKSTETRSTRAKCLKIRYEHPESGPAEIVCDTSLLTPLFNINDSLKLCVTSNRVLIKHWLYVILAPLALAGLGVASLYVYMQ